VFTDEQSKHKVIDAGHDLSGFSFGHPGSVFLQGDISAIVKTVFDAPIRTNGIQQAFWVHLISAQTSKAINGLLLNIAGLEGGDTAFSFEDLLEVRPIQELVPLAADRERSFFQPPVPFAEFFGNRKILGQIGAAWHRGWVWLKPQANIFFHLRLVAFGDPDIISAAFDNLNRNGSLGMLRIPHDNLVA